jgi:hypothetical protein
MDRDRWNKIMASDEQLEERVREGMAEQKENMGREAAAPSQRADHPSPRPIIGALSDRQHRILFGFGPNADDLQEDAERLAERQPSESDQQGEWADKMMRAQDYEEGENPPGAPPRKLG